MSLVAYIGLNEEGSAVAGKPARRAASRVERQNLKTVMHVSKLIWPPKWDVVIVTSSDYNHAPFRGWYKLISLLVTPNIASARKLTILASVIP